MTDSIITEAARAFIASHLRDFDDLKLLVAMVATPDRWWDADTTARELRIDQSRARASLEHLASRNLLEIRVTGDVRYQFRPGTPELRSAALSCLEACHATPAIVMGIVSEQMGQRSIRDVAEAFRRKRDDDR